MDSGSGDQTRSNATANNDAAAKKPGGVTGKGFVKGDARINRKGRPKSFDKLRELAQLLACEVVESADTGDVSSRVEMILRDWAQSKDPRKQQAFIEYAYGKVANREEYSGPGGGPIQIQATDYRVASAALSPRPVGNRSASGQDESRGDGPAVGENDHVR